MHWPYDRSGRLTGGHVYEHADLTEVRRIAAPDFITVADARARLDPRIRSLPG